MQNTLIHHVPSRNRKKLIGTVVATRILMDNTSKIVVSWSKCNHKLGDKYDKFEGERIAVNRAHYGTNKSIPPAITKQFNDMVKRASRYFKGTEVIAVKGRRKGDLTGAYQS